MFTGQIKSFGDIQLGDVRMILPKLRSENFGTNMKLIKELEKIGEKEKLHTGSAGTSLASKSV